MCELPEFSRSHHHYNLYVPLSAQHVYTFHEFINCVPVTMLGIREVRLFRTADFA